MDVSNLKSALLAIAKECIDQGPGFAQEPVVLRDAAQRLINNSDLKEQQRLLTAWHDLFRDGALAWGYDIDNPSSPFFHVADR
jgi:hypothetical protein